MQLARPSRPNFWPRASSGVMAPSRLMTLHERWMAAAASRRARGGRSEVVITHSTVLLAPSREVGRRPPTVSAVTLRPVALAFVLFGVFWGSWAVATADIERGLGFSHAEFGLLLAGALVGASAANAVGGPLTERWGTGRALSRGLLAWGALMIVAGALRSPAAFAVALTAMVSAGGAVDVVMNVVSAAAFASAPGRLVRFHGLFNAGAAAGALATGLMLHAGISWRWLWPFVGVAAIALGAASSRATLPAGDTGDHHSMIDSLRAVRRERLIVLSIAFAVSAMIEGGISTWGVLYLREQLASGILLGTAAAAAGFAVAAVARAALGPLAAAGGAGRGVTIGAGLAAAGLVMLAATDVAAVGAIGLVAAAMGISMCWPLLVARANAGRARPGLVVGGVTAAGYLGLVLGPAVVGGMASTVGLRGGLLLLAASALFVALAPNRTAAPVDR
jgi:MFS family permease